MREKQQNNIYTGKKFGKLWIIDGSYLIQRALNVPNLWELKDKKTGLRTGGIFGFLRSLNSEFKKLDYYPVVIWDDGLSPRRLQVYNQYKHGDERMRDKILRECDTPEQIEARLCKEFADMNENTIEAIRASIAEVRASATFLQDYKTHDDDNYGLQYGRQRSILIGILNSLGIPSIRYRRWEGDDLQVLLSRMCERAVIMTDDKDLIQMLSPTVDILRPMQEEYLTYEKYMKENDLVSYREIIIHKAIVGDGSDNIPSVTSEEERKYSLGSTRARTVARIIVDHDEDPEKYLPYLESLGKNYYKGFIKHHDDYIRNMKLVDLDLVENDETVMRNMATEILSKAGKCNLMEALILIGEQGITSFDTNGLIAKLNLLSCKLTYEE